MNNSEGDLLRTKIDQLHADLQSAEADTVKLAYQLYSRGVVGKGIRNEVEEAATPSKAASKLLCAVENRIESHPRELHTFLECLSTFPTWEHLAEIMAVNLKKLEEKMVRPLPVSDSSTSTTPVNISLTVSTNTSHHRQECATRNFVLQGAPIQRKRLPQQATITPPQSTNKPFTKASSPFTDTPGTSGYDQSIPSCSSSASLSKVEEKEAEETDIPPPDHRSTLSLTSQISNSSTFGEDVLSMQGVIEKILRKYSDLKRKLSSCEREKEEMRKRFDAAVESVNQDTKELNEHSNKLQKENSDLKERLETMREAVIAGNRQKKLLMDQLQMAEYELKKYKEIYSNVDGTIVEEYQKSKEREKELEDQLTACRKTVADHEERIQLLEEEINILLKLGSVSPSPSYSEALTVNPEQEDSGGFLSLGSM